MNRHKRFGSAEINLTPLLDVLFTILFIVMLGSARNEENTKKEADIKLETLKSNIENLENEVKYFKDQVESYDMYTTNAVVINITNSIEGDEHILMVTDGINEDTYEVIKLGKDRLSYVKNRLSGIISSVIDIADEQPVYIVFHCDKSIIYTSEYSAIDSELRYLQDNYKAVFCKIVSEVKENE